MQYTLAICTYIWNHQRFWRKNTTLISPYEESTHDTRSFLAHRKNQIESSAKKQNNNNTYLDGWMGVWVCVWVDCLRHATTPGHGKEQKQTNTTYKCSRQPSGLRHARARTGLVSIVKKYSGMFQRSGDSHTINDHRGRGPGERTV